MTSTATVYTPPPTLEEIDTAGLFPDPSKGEKTLRSPGETAMVIRAAIVEKLPEDLGQLAVALKTTESQLRWACHLLQFEHRMTDVGITGVYAKLDAIADFNRRYDPKGDKRRSDEALAQWDADRRAKNAAMKFEMPEADPSNPEEMRAVGEALIKAIEQAEPTSYEDMSMKLEVDLGSLMALLKVLSGHHGFERLSDKSIHLAIEYWSGKQSSAVIKVHDYATTFTR